LTPNGEMQATQRMENTMTRRCKSHLSIAKLKMETLINRWQILMLQAEPKKHCN